MTKTKPINKPISHDKRNVRAWFQEPANWDNRKLLTYKEVVVQIILDKGMEIKEIEKPIDPSRPFGKTITEYYIFVDNKKNRPFPEFAYKYYKKLTEGVL